MAEKLIQAGASVTFAGADRDLSIIADWRYVLSWPDAHDAILIDTHGYLTALSLASTGRGEGRSGGNGRASPVIGLTRTDIQLASLMSAGMADDTASRLMEMSVRSYRRIYEELTEQIEAKSRAHFGFEIADLLPRPRNPRRITPAQNRLNDQRTRIAR